MISNEMTHSVDHQSRMNKVCNTKPLMGQRIEDLGSVYALLVHLDMTAYRPSPNDHAMEFPVVSYYFCARHCAYAANILLLFLETMSTACTNAVPDRRK